MKLYTTPGGQWAGTEANWKAALKREGIDPKTYTGRSQVEVPTSKPALLEFLTFNNVNVISPGAISADAAGGGAPPPAPPPAAPDVEVLRALHNPDPAIAVTPQLGSNGPTLVAFTTMPDLDAAFMAAPISKQLALAEYAVSAAEVLLRDRTQ